MALFLASWLSFNEDFIIEDTPHLISQTVDWDKVSDICNVDSDL